VYFALEMKELKDDCEHFEISPPGQFAPTNQVRNNSKNNFMLQNLNENQDFLLHIVLNFVSRIISQFP